MGKTAKVAVYDTDYSQVGHAVEAVFRKFSFLLQDKLVFVKPNILGSYKVERSVTTHPNIVSAVVKYLKSKGARVVVGDNSGLLNLGEIEKAARFTGIMEASMGCYRNIGREVAKVNLDFIGESLTISRIIQECDLLISLPRFKTHLNTIITGGIKNSFGFLCGAEKPKMHRRFQTFRDFSRAVVEIFAIRKPDLTIMDAVVAMEGDGPNSPYLRRLNKLIASTDAVALDRVVAHMMGAQAEKVFLFQYAKEKNLGETELERIEIEGDASPIPQFRLPKSYGIQTAANTFYERVIQWIAAKEKLGINKVKCIKCLKCYESCPVNAIRLDNGYPFINTELCIKCYCCKEVCGFDAIYFTQLFGILQRLKSKKPG